jgi:methionyl-tRNA synthetase
MGKRYYITTPIYYVNSVPHIGTALTTVAADITARYQRMRGREVHFLTGTDENATKVAEAAAAAGKGPIAFVDEISEEFRKIWRGLNLQYSDFIRTTEERHKLAVQEVFARLLKAGYIYEDAYKGWYDVSSETFFKENEVVDGKSPDGNPVRWVEESNYFFKLSAFADRLLRHIEENPEFILPETRRNEVVSFIRQGLRDACITRTNSGWGIPVPGNPEKVVYVWFDALINYISAIGWPDGDYQDYWPADVEWMGKDILVRFHATLWPAMLMGLGLPLPKTLVGHGWVLTGTEKISKSKGNTVAPLSLAADLSERTGCSPEVAVDAVRYYMARTMPFETDYSFTYDDFDGRYNSELVNDISNGIHRVISMTNNFCGGLVPSGKVNEGARAAIERSLAEYERGMEAFRIDQAVAAIGSVAQTLNGFIDSQKPWELNKAGKTAELGDTMLTLLWIVRTLEGVLRPVTPILADRISALLALKPNDCWDDLAEVAQLASGHKVAPAEAIYPRLEKKTMIEATEQTLETDEITIDDFMKVKLRIARVLDAQAVPDADKLLRLQLLVGGEQRQVLAGIAQKYSPDDVIGKQVVVVTNLKARKLRGFESQGMILAADAEDGSAILLMPDKEAPDGAPVH